MEMNFFSIDFETANPSRSSACALGIVEVKNGSIANEYYYLIDPDDYFDDYCMSIHGITPSMVRGKPKFGKLWSSIRLHFQGNLVIAHNASFDMSVLRYCLSRSSIPFPPLYYFCTYSLSKKTLPGLPGYKLNMVADHFDIEFKHHNALEDAQAAAAIMLKLMDGYSDIEDFCRSLGYKSGELFEGGYRPFTSQVSGKNLRSKDITT
jgi:DNA polymerase-3 subunit epsilon